MTLRLREYQAADNAWHEALVAAYGSKQAGDARYDQRGDATPELAALKAARNAAMRAYFHVEDARRKALS